MKIRTNTFRRLGKKFQTIVGVIEFDSTGLADIGDLSLADVVSAIPDVFPVVDESADIEVVRAALETLTEDQLRVMGEQYIGESLGSLLAENDKTELIDVFISYNEDELLAIVISTSTLPRMLIDVLYSAQIVATGGADDLEYSLDVEDHPEGIVIDPDTGELSGANTGGDGTGDFEITVIVTDGVVSVTKVLTLTVANSSEVGVHVMRPAFVNSVDNSAGRIVVDNVGVATYNDIIDDLRSLDGSTQAYTCLDPIEVEVADYDDVADMSCIVVVTAADGTTTKNFLLVAGTEAIAWDYEGIMEVGATIDGNVGWSAGVDGYGAMNSYPPTTPLISDLYIQGTILNCHPTVDMAAVTVEINGQLFELDIDDSTAFFKEGVTRSLFPAEGETCTIKLLCTLA